MKITRGLAHHERSPYPVLTIGNFDGQHCGHQALLKAVVTAAQAARGRSVVLTFDPHPITVLRPGVNLRLLMSMEEKLARFEQAGIDEVLFLAFTPAFAALTPEQFVFQILRDGIGLRELFVGQHFAFGKDRAGHMDDLRRLGAEAGFVVHPMPPVLSGGEVVSSTRIRHLVKAGDMRDATRCLGRPYALYGKVVRGAQRGQGLGWPTANLRLPEERVLPPDGVYAATVVWKNRRFPSVAYIGTRPTFDAGERLLEVYLLDQQVALYGEEIGVEVIERIRDDAKFDSAEALAARIDLDVRQARKALAEEPQTVTNG